MNIITQTRFVSLGNDARTVRNSLHDALNQWLSPARILSNPWLKIFVTDNVELASEAKSDTTNNLIILISSKPETVTEGVEVIGIDGFLTDNIYGALLNITSR